MRAYKVSLPWRSLTARANVGDNFSSALKRLQSLHKRTFSQDPELEESYYGIFKKYFDLGFIEFVPPNEIKPYHLYNHPVYYLPHRAVLKPGSSSPIRPVFDASAPTSTGKSLNAALMVGPNLFPDLVQVLLKFRR